MENVPRGRPLSDRLEQLRARGYRYVDLWQRSGEVRSTAWFNNLLNKGPSAVSPPEKPDFEAFAKLLDTTARHVAEMIAEEWYGVATADISERVRALAPRLDALSAEDAGLVEQLVQRLQPASP